MLLGAFENPTWTRVGDWGQNLEFHKILNINETSDITDITSDITDITSDITEITDMFRTQIAQVDSNFSGQLLHTTGKSGKSSISKSVKCF